MAGIDNNTVLYLRGDSFNDLSLNIKNVINNGNVTISKIDNYSTYKFNSSNYLSVNSIVSDEFTVEFNFLIDNLSSGEYRIVEMNSDANHRLLIYTYQSKLVFWSKVTGVHYLNFDFDVNTRRWCHLAITKANNVYSLYLDGKLATSFSDSSTVKDLDIGNDRYVPGGYKHNIYNIRVSNIVRYEQDFTPQTQLFNSININVTSKDFAKADFNISKLGQETINKVEIYQNEEVKETYIDSYDNLTFNHGGKNFKIVVTYDDNYTEEQEIHIGNSKAKIYLYKEGNECESITGGITDADMLDSTGNHWKVNGTLTKNENSIHIQTGSTTTSVKFAKTKNLIDLTKFKDLYINVLNTTEYSPDKFTCLLVSKTLDIGNSASGFTRNVNTKGLNKLDISDKTESYYVATRVLNNSSVLEFDYIYLETNENVISINSQNTSSINFSCNNLDNLITITKAEVYINDKLSKSYNDNFDSITYNIDNSLCSIGYNKIVVKVTYSQGDDIYETVEEVLTHTNTVNNLPTSSSLKELIDRQELLTNSIEVQKNTLKSILESKNVEVADSENKLSILIDKVNKFDNYIPPILYLYKEGNECIDVTGGWSDNTASIGSYYKNRVSCVKNSNNMELAVSRNFATCIVNTNNIIDMASYSKICFDIEIPTYTATIETNCVVTLRENLTSMNSSDTPSNIAASTYTKTLARSVIELSLNGVSKAYPSVHALIGNQSSKTCKIIVYNVWLER